MKTASFDLPPVDGKAIHQLIDHLIGVMRGVRGQVRVSGRGQNASVAEDFLHLQQVNAGFNQMSGIAMAQTVRRNLFFIPQACTTLCIVV